MFTMHTCEQVQKDARAAGIKDVISKSDAIGNHLLASLRNNLRSAFPSHQRPRIRDLWKSRPAVSVAVLQHVVRQETQATFFVTLEPSNPEGGRSR
jgi:hypothetical protein